MTELVLSVDLANLGQDVSSWKALSGLFFFFSAPESMYKTTCTRNGFLSIFLMSIKIRHL